MQATDKIRTTDLAIIVPHGERSLNPLNPQEIVYLDQVLGKKTSKEMRLMVELGRHTGLRIDEVVTFSVELVFPPPSEEMIEVEIGPHVGVMTKYSKKRNVEIRPNIRKELHDYSVSDRRKKRVAKAGDLGNHPPLFINQYGKPYTTKSIDNLWAAICKKVRKISNLPFLHDFHDLRATYATYRLQELLDSGVAPSEALTRLMGWMGHKKEQTTWKYLIFICRHDWAKSSMSMGDDLLDEVYSEDAE